MKSSKHQGGYIVLPNKGEKGGKRMSDFKNESERSKEDFNDLTSENSHLVQALKKERKRSALLLSQLEDQKHLRSTGKITQVSDQKFLHPTYNSLIEGFTKKIDHLEEEIQAKAVKIFNICVLFKRLKRDKDILKAKLEFQEAEFDEVTKDLLQKLAESRDEINYIADSRDHSMNDYRAATTKKIVQKNVQLSAENSKLILETCQLKQKIRDLENRKQELRAVPSRVSFSRSSLQSRSIQSKYSRKTSAMVNGPAYWEHKKLHKGKNRCQSCQKFKYTDDEGLTDFTNDSSTQSMHDKINIGEKSSINKFNDCRSGGDAQNVQMRERKYKFDEKPKQKGLYSHHHKTEKIFKKNKRESLILQATSVKSDQSLELAPKVRIQQTSKQAIKFPKKEINLINGSEDGNQRKHISRQSSEEFLPPVHCLLHNSKFNSNDDSETLMPANEYLGEEIGCKNGNVDRQDWRQSSEESLRSPQYGLRASKSAPEILESVEFQEASENSDFDD